MHTRGCLINATKYCISMRLPEPAPADNNIATALRPRDSLSQGKAPMLQKSQLPAPGSEEPGGGAVSAPRQAPRCPLRFILRCQCAAVCYTFGIGFSSFSCLLFHLQNEKKPI